MPTCGCVKHTEFCKGESGPVFKISNKKIKKETVEKLRRNGLLGQYCNFVCKICVAFVESDAFMSGKRKFEDDMVEDFIRNIESGSCSEKNLIDIAAALGKKISDAIYDDSVSMSREYLTPDNLIHLNVEEWIGKRNPVLTEFLMCTAKCNSGELKKKNCIVGAIESVYKARNLNTISTVSYGKNLIAFYMSQSKNVITLFNSCRPAGSYFSLKKWLSTIGTVPLDSSLIKENDCITFFDNSQVLARNWRVNYNYKSKASVITTTANIVLQSSLQKNPALSPSQWLYSNTEVSTVKLREYIDEQKSVFCKIRNQFLFYQIQSLKNRSRLEDGVYTDNISELLKDNVVSFDDKDTPNDPYDWVNSVHLDPSPDISVGEPLMLNPCSFASVEKVLKEISKRNGVTDGLKAWCVIGCDGLPYTLGTKLLQRNECLQNIVLIPGHGHIEMNAVKAIFKILWYPGMQDLAKQCGFNSPRAQVCAQSCSDHHKAFMLLRIFFESTLMEILTTFLQNCYENSRECSVDDFFKYIKNSNRNFRFMSDIVINYILPIMIYRAGVRRNNYEYICAGKSQFMKLFFATGMPNYQKLIINDIKTYILAPSEVKEFLQKTQSFTVSGHPSKGEGGDFILEAMNGRIKRWLPHGIPTEKHWQEVCRNSDFLQKISDKFLKSADINEKKNNVVYERDISGEVTQYRMRIRQLRYLCNDAASDNIHTSITGDILDKDLHAFETQMEMNLHAFIENGDKSSFTPVFTTEAQRSIFHSIERKTKKQLTQIIEEGMVQVQENGDIDESLVLQKMWMKVKTRPKSEMLHFYKEVVTAIENSTGSNSSDGEYSEEGDEED